MKSILDNLSDFINRAERERKYLPSTAHNFRTPLRLIEGELTEEEKQSLDVLKNHLNEIFHLIYSKGKTNLAASSLQTYKKRLNSLIADYEKYGTDPAKMALWNRELITRKSNKDSKKHDLSDKKQASPVIERVPSDQPEMTRFEIPLRSGSKAIILTPPDPTLDELTVIEGYINFLKTTVKKSKTSSENDGGVA